VASRDLYKKYPPLFAKISPAKTNTDGKDRVNANQKARNLKRNVREAPNITSKIILSLKRVYLEEYKKFVKASSNRHMKKYKFMKYPISNPKDKKPIKIIKALSSPKYFNASR